MDLLFPRQEEAVEYELTQEEFTHLCQKNSVILALTRDLDNGVFKRVKKAILTLEVE